MQQKRLAIINVTKSAFDDRGNIPLNYLDYFY